MVFFDRFVFYHPVYSSLLGLHAANLKVHVLIAVSSLFTCSNPGERGKEGLPRENSLVVDTDG